MSLAAAQPQALGHTVDALAPPQAVDADQAAVGLRAMQTPMGSGPGGRMLPLARQAMLAAVVVGQQQLLAHHPMQRQVVAAAAKAVARAAVAVGVVAVAAVVALPPPRLAVQLLRRVQQQAQQQQAVMQVALDPHSVVVLHPRFLA